MSDDARRSSGRDPEEERERLYQLGALAQSYAPRGLARVLNLTPEERARARAAWRARPRWERILQFAVLAIQLVCVSVLIWGVARRDGVMVLAGAGALVAMMLGTAAASIVVEMRRANARRRARRGSSGSSR